MTDATPLASEQITQDVYPASQEEAQRADGWRFHYGSRCPADCDEVYYRRRGGPMEALGPTPPDLIRWTDTGDSSDILAWHPVFSGFQRRHRIAALSATPAPSDQDASPAEVRSMETAPKDGTMLRLLVDYTDGGGPLDDALKAWTIGFNDLDGTGVDEWKFAGWCWTHDHFSQGSGTPVGWLPWSNPSTGGDEQ